MLLRFQKGSPTLQGISYGLKHFSLIKRVSVEEGDLTLNDFDVAETTTTVKDLQRFAI